MTQETGVYSQTARGYHVVMGPIRRHHSISVTTAMFTLIQITTVSTRVPFGSAA